MSTLVVQTANLTWRELRFLLRQPAYLAFNLVQPMVWLLLFGQLFKKVTEIPGFGGGSYIGFMTPGIVCMTVLFSSAWSGMGFIQDMDRGVMNRFLVSPTSRTAMLGGKLAYHAITLAVQTLIVIGVGLATGARYAGGVIGVLVTLLAAVLLSLAFGSFSNALALLIRTPEALIGIANFLVLPLTFTSSALMATSVAPSWLQTASKYNPVNWAVDACREALSGSGDWASIGLHLAGLAAFAAVLMWLATRAFRVYQKSV